MSTTSRTITVTVDGKEYTSKATLGLYNKACSKVGMDIRVLFSNELPTGDLVLAFAEVVSGLSAEEVAEGVSMADYTTITEAIMNGIIPSKPDEESNPTEDTPKN